MSAPPSAGLHFEAVARSDVGRVRPGNEDSAFVGPALLLVADGIGGAAVGELASTTAAVVLAGVAGLEAGPDPGVVLGHGIARAAEELRAAVEVDPSRSGTGTTCTAVLTDGRRVSIAHVGDSRAYLLRAGRLRRLTTDHTLAQAMVRAGRLSADAAEHSTYGRVLTRALGAGRPPHPDVGPLGLAVGDRLLLCSDGLSDLVDDTELARALGLPDGLDAVADRLVATALRAGGHDNVTAVVADVAAGSPPVPQGGPAPLDGRYAGAAAAAARRLGS